MSENFVVRTAVFSSGERFPVLLHRDSMQPVTLVTRYIIDMRRERKQSSTIERGVRVIGWLYDWAKHLGINLEEMLRAGELIPHGKLIGFLRYLRTYRNHKVIGSIGFIDHKKVRVLSAQTFNTYIGIIKDFLIWAVNEYFPRNEKIDQVGEAIRRAQKSIEKSFKGQSQRGRNAAVMGLTDEMYDFLLEVIKPGTKGNPFKRYTQFRNYLIVKLMLATGLRRGEVLKLKLSCLPVGAKKTLSVIRLPDDPEDTRKSGADVKRLEREISLAPELAKELWLYVRKYRRNGRHQYLFTSHRKTGQPLCSGGVNWIFSQLFKKFFAEHGVSLHPHIARHTFNDRFVKLAHKKGWNSDKVEKVQKYLNGWSENSKMPQRYSKRATEEIADMFMEEYQNALYNV